MQYAVALDRIEARIRALQDLDAIETLKARYWRAIDRRRPDDVAACLAEDVSVDFETLPRYQGRVAFMGMVRQAAKQAQVFGMHHGQNPAITLTGPDDAAGEWDVFYYGIDAASGILTQMGGVYRDAYRRIDGRWVVSKMIMRMNSLHVQKVDGRVSTLVLGRPPEGGPAKL
jgi:hypothetical protein